MEQEQVMLSGEQESTHEHPRSMARQYAVQYLFQCECGGIMHFVKEQFQTFADHFSLPEKVTAYSEELVSGCLSLRIAIDEKIQTCSTNWRIDRMPITDRCVLRLATFELMQTTTPTKVVLNESIELAKKYGTHDSGAFVNGVLDHLASLIRSAVVEPVDQGVPPVDPVDPIQ